MKNEFKASAERFARETAHHELTILHDDGLYRHLRFRGTEQAWAYWFDLVTWPNNLVFRGDGETFAFSRVEDMFGFFRDSSGWNGQNINPQYWAEKITDGGERTMRYSETVFRRKLWSAVRDDIADYRGLAKAVQAALEDYDTSTEFGANEFLRDFEYQVTEDGPETILGGRISTTRTFRFGGAWEWNLTDWHWWYLWACHAIQWGIQQYDQAKALTTVGGEVR